MLSASASLGAVLIHDGEVGTDEHRLPYAEEGDRLGLKGMPAAFRLPDTTAWDSVRPFVHGASFLLTGLEFPVLVVGLESVPEDEVIVHGAVLFHGEHPDGGHLLIVDAQHVDKPFFDWA